MKKAQLNWGILGAAKIARSVAPAIRDSEWARPYAVASRSLAKAESFAADQGFEKCYGTYDALLADPEVDVIYIPLPNNLHCDWTLKSLKAGKHVLCEKPLADNVAQCRRMISAAKKGGRLLMEAFMYRFHPQTAKIQEAIAGREIGDIRIVRASFGFTLSEEATNVRLAEELTGGSLMDVGCYCVNAMRHFFGEEPNAVLAYAGRGTRTNVDLTFAAILLFSNNRVGLFNSSFQTILDWGLEIVGTKGRISIPSPWKPDPELVSFVLEADGKARTVEVKNGGRIYHLEVDHFSRCILEGRQPGLAPEDGLRNMAVIEALRRAARTGKVVKVASEA